jgi:hypothetical protein
MFAREVSVQLKANAGAEFTRTIEKDILPRLRKQAGFADELTFLNPNGKEAVAISLWDRKESADNYARDTYQLDLPQDRLAELRRTDLLDAGGGGGPTGLPPFPVEV